MELKDLHCFAWIKKTILILTFLLIFMLLPKQTLASQSYDLSNTNNYNFRFDGAVANDRVGYLNNVSADIDNNGVADLIIHAKGADNNERSVSTSVYIILDSLLSSHSGTGNNMDLSDPNNYNLRIDGATALASQFTMEVRVVDITGDGKNELVLNNHYASTLSRSNNGAVYIIPNSVLAGQSGTGNTIDLADSSNWTLRIDGHNDSDNFGYSFTSGDFDGDGSTDLAVNASGTDFNSRNKSGSIYVFLNSLINYSSTGNLLDTANTSDFSVRFDGPAATSYGTFAAFLLTAADFDGDGKDGLIFGDSWASTAGRSANGAVWILSDEKITSQSAGSIVDLDTSSNFSIRFDGPSTNSHINVAYTSDITGNGTSEVFIADYPPLYIEDSLLTNYINLSGQTIDLADSSNYSASFGSELESVGTIMDFNQDGRKDVLTSNWYYVYIFDNSLFANISGTGNSIDASVNGMYLARFYEDTESSGVYAYTFQPAGDLDNNGSPDILMGSDLTDFNSRSNSGSVWVVYNFPHTISLDQPDIPSGALDMTVSGNVDAANSVSNISGVQWSLGNGPVNDTWNGCTASDGSFDSTSEEFSCDVSGLTDGSDSDIYIRAYDANTSYTAQSRYYSLNREGSGQSTDDPNVIQGWVKKILAGPNYHGTVEYIKDTAIDGVALLIPNEASNIDLHVNFEKIPVEKTIYIPDVSIPFPWSQGRNTVADVYNIEAQAAFNGNKVVETEGPFIIALNYDPDKLYGLDPDVLKITRYNTETNKWTPITAPHVVNEDNSTTSTTTTTFGYYTVSYPASVWK